MEPGPKPLTRRDFLKLGSIAFGAAALDLLCASPKPSPIASPAGSPTAAPALPTETATAIPYTETAVPRVNLITDPEFADPELIQEITSRGIDPSGCVLDEPEVRSLGRVGVREMIEPAKESLLINSRFPAEKILCTSDTATGKPLVYFEYNGRFYAPDAERRLVEVTIDHNGTLATPTPETSDTQAPYPTDTSEFILGAGGEEFTREQIANLDGFGYTENLLQKLEGWWKGKLPAGSQFVYEVNAEAQTWRAIPRTADGKLIIPRYTKGEETGLLESGLMPVRYLYKGQVELQQLGNDFFEGIVVNDPWELVGKGHQQLIKTATGHFIIGFMNADGNLYAWLDAAHDKWKYTAAGIKVAATATPEPKPTKKPTQPSQEQPATPTTQPQLPVEPAPSGNCTDVERSEKRFTFGTLSNQFGNHGPGAPFPESPLFGKEQIFVKVTRKPDSSNTIEVFAGEFGTRIINLNGVNIWMENSPLGGLAKQFCHPNVIGENDTIFLYVPQGSDLTMGIWPVEIARGQR